MRAPSARMFTNAVVARVLTWGTSKGARVVTSTAETARLASMQPMRPERVAFHGLDGSTTNLTGYFPAPDPGLKVSDQVEWNGTVYHVLGPAYDPAGKGALYLVDCKATR